MLKKTIFAMLALLVVTLCVCAVSCTDGDKNNNSSYETQSSEVTFYESSDIFNDSSDIFSNESNYDNATIGDDESGIVSDLLSGITS